MNLLHGLNIASLPGRCSLTLVSAEWRIVQSSGLGTNRCVVYQLTNTLGFHVHALDLKAKEHEGGGGGGQEA